MCFYEQIRFQCGDWKWGKFKRRCASPCGLGGACAVKLVSETLDQPNKCSLCEKHDAKVRKREAECERIQRWQREATEPASIEKALSNIAAIDAELKILNQDITRRRTCVPESRPAPQDDYPDRRYSTQDHSGTTYHGTNNIESGHAPQVRDQNIIPFGLYQDELYQGRGLLKNVAAPESTDNKPLTSRMEKLALNNGMGQRKLVSTEPDQGRDVLISQVLREGNVLKRLGAEPLRARKVKRPMIRDGLEILLGKHGEQEAIPSCADSGSCINAMSSALALQLGIRFKKHNAFSAQTMYLPDGSKIKSCGSFKDMCSILSVAGQIFATIFTEILVFENLVNPPMLIGDAALDEAGVWENADRVLRPAGCIPEIPTVRSLGNSCKIIRCCFEGKGILVFPDSGSQLDCISKSLAHRKYMPVHKPRYVTFANGTTAESTHIVRGRLSIGWNAPVYDDEPECPAPASSTVDDLPEDSDSSSDTDVEEELLLTDTKEVVDLEFHTIQNLQYDFIIGGRTLEALQAYQRHRHEFLEVRKKQRGGINRIFCWTRKTLRKDSEAQLDAVSNEAINRANQDQLENARREEADEHIRSLIGDARVQAQVIEDERRRRYDGARAP